MAVSISKNNKKMGGIPSISFPPVVTCANCAECSKKCYAKKMANFRPSIGQAWENNLTEWKQNPDAVKYAILSNAITSGYFRYFVGGDIVDADFFSVMVEIANIAKNCQFLAFTKKYNIVNAYIDNGGTIPENLHIIFSGWGDKLIPNNPHKLPQSDVIFKGQEEPTNAKICGGNCVDCICKGVACWDLKQGETIYFYEH
jgi:hypothetical protein